MAANRSCNRVAVCLPMFSNKTKIIYWMLYTTVKYQI